jgi:hypothetical protein
MVLAGPLWGLSGPDAAPGALATKTHPLPNHTQALTGEADAAAAEVSRLEGADIRSMWAHDLDEFIEVGGLVWAGGGGWLSEWVAASCGCAGARQPADTTPTCIQTQHAHTPPLLLPPPINHQAYDQWEADEAASAAQLARQQQRHKAKAGGKGGAKGGAAAAKKGGGAGAGKKAANPWSDGEDGSGDDMLLDDDDFYEVCLCVCVCLLGGSNSQAGRPDGGLERLQHQQGQLRSRHDAPEVLLMAADG